MSTDSQWIRVEDVAARLRVSLRQAARYAGKVRTRKEGRRVLFHAGDIDMLARQQNVEYKPPVRRVEMIPAGEMLDYIDRLHGENARLHEELGRERGLREAREQELDMLRQLVGPPVPLRKASFWQRLLAMLTGGGTA